MKLFVGKLFLLLLIANVAMYFHAIGDRTSLLFLALAGVLYQVIITTKNANV